MYCYIITLNLNNKDKDYSELFKAIEDLGKCKKVLESCWIVETNVRANNIARYLYNHIEDNDRLFVGKLSGEATWINVLCDDEWLKDNL